eukprot:scaffold133980_cov36-Prasinocladus_malaysianus.AAC.2
MHHCKGGCAISETKKHCCVSHSSRSLGSGTISTCAMTTMRAVWRIKQLLPPMLGPVTSMALCCPLPPPPSRVSLATHWAGSRASSIGWRPPRIDIWGSSSGPTSSGRQKPAPEDTCGHRHVTL